MTVSMGKGYENEPAKKVDDISAKKAEQVKKAEEKVKVTAEQTKQIKALAAEGYTEKEIAEKLDLPERTVYMRLKPTAKT